MTFAFCVAVWLAFCIVSLIRGQAEPDEPDIDHEYEAWKRHRDAKRNYKQAKRELDKYK